jgi:hypothetical protein
MKRCILRVRWPFVVLRVCGHVLIVTKDYEAGEWIRCRQCAKGNR